MYSNYNEIKGIKEMLKNARKIKKSARSGFDWLCIIALTEKRIESYQKAFNCILDIDPVKCTVTERR